MLTAERDQPEPLPATGNVVGIEPGIANFLADSNGEFVPSPRLPRQDVRLPRGRGRRVGR